MWAKYYYKRALVLQYCLHSSHSQKVKLHIQNGSCWLEAAPCWAVRDKKGTSQRFTKLRRDGRDLPCPGPAPHSWALQGLWLEPKKEMVEWEVCRPQALLHMPAGVLRLHRDRPTGKGRRTHLARKEMPDDPDDHLLVLIRRLVSRHNDFSAG